MAEIFCTTQRLVLRSEAEGDLDAWLAQVNTPEVMACLGGVQSRAQVEEAFRRMAQPAAKGEPPYLFVERASDGLLLGKCGLSLIEGETVPASLKRQVQIGWTLRADCWGQGYASEAAQAMFAHAFGAMALDRVWGQTSESNPRSWRVMTRAGMRRRAELDYADPAYPPEDNPTMVWSLEAADWRAHG